VEKKLEKQFNEKGFYKVVIKRLLFTFGALLMYYILFRYDIIKRPDEYLKHIKVIKYMPFLGISGVLLGNLANVLVMRANNYRMPFKIPKDNNKEMLETAKRSKWYTPLSSESKMVYLCDRFEGRRGIKSLGDILIDYGSIACIVSVIAIFLNLLFVSLGIAYK